MSSLPGWPTPTPSPSQRRTGFALRRLSEPTAPFPHSYAAPRTVLASCDGTEQRETAKARCWFCDHPLNSGPPRHACWFFLQ